ncbi:hypothetical protein [Fodinicola feengrottensis]|uniref:hypothetical protein n=1 Tax=Fodinicola feengrottensis TaxID=435914 RepID=UPI0013D58433|nr:hypothetical protein [Fodinicola feengrottensis]
MAGASCARRLGCSLCRPCLTSRFFPLLLVTRSIVVRCCGPPQQTVAAVGAAEIINPQAALSAETVRPAAAAAAPSVWVRGAADRLFPTSVPEVTATISLGAAKGEHEAAQVMVRSSSALSGVSLSTTALTGPGGATIAASQIQLRRQYPHGNVDAMGQDPIGTPTDNEVGPSGTNVYYDALLDNAPITVAANTTQPYHVGVRVPADQTAGITRARSRFPPAVAVSRYPSVSRSTTSPCRHLRRAR